MAKTPTTKKKVEKVTDNILKATVEIEIVCKSDNDIFNHLETIRDALENHICYDASYKCYITFPEKYRKSMDKGILFKEQKVR